MFQNVRDISTADPTRNFQQIKLAVFFAPQKLGVRDAALVFERRKQLLIERLQLAPLRGTVRNDRGGKHSAVMRDAKRWRPVTAYAACKHVALFNDRIDM